MLDEKSKAVLRKRLLRKRVTIYSIAGLIFIIGGRVYGLDPFEMAIGFAFCVGFSAVTIPLTAKQKLKTMAAARYQVTASHIKFWSEDDRGLSQTIDWNNITEFEIAFKRTQSYVLLSADRNARVRIWEADLFTSDSGEEPLPVAAAYHLSKR